MSIGLYKIAKQKKSHKNETFQNFYMMFFNNLHLKFHRRCSKLNRNEACYLKLY